MSTKGFRPEPVYETPQDFINQAASHTVVSAPAPVKEAAPKPKPVAKPKPWESANPRVKVPFTLRMDEPLHAKLAYVAERLPGTSMHAIMMQAASEKLEALIREIEKADK